MGFTPHASPADAGSAAAAIRAAQTGVVANLALAGVKIAAGIVGNAYALVADGVESLADVASSLLVWSGIALGARPADDDHPFGHGKAEPLAAVAVSLMLLAAALGIAVQSVREIRRPHEFPATWTLAVLVGVIVIKTILARRIHAVGVSSGSFAVEADATHHLSDAVTSAAAFIGISVALVGRRMSGDARWAAADDWAAIVASLVIARSGLLIVRVALDDLMDRTPGESVLAPLRAAALSVDGVCAVEKLAARRVGLGYRVTVHVQADPAMSLADAHALGGGVKHSMYRAVPRVQSVLVHMEPFQDDAGEWRSADQP